ncbi:ITG-like peptide isoform X1 [Tubulanus polymorphus]|uniref:ITG-like peptide isoform X1 n=1 Tax=Tubulanus polymorphus TaxID=672921 RepID=UPI003DA2C3FC
MNGLLCFGVLTIVIVSCHGWKNGEPSYSDGYRYGYPSRRNSWCGKQGNRCFQSSQCCMGFYCASLESAEGKGLWGACTPTCESDVDCADGEECTLGAVGKASVRMCTDKKQTRKAGLGELCEDSSDCDISQGLCCQTVTFHRRRPKRVCDDISGFAKCIKPTKYTKMNRL